MQDKPKPGKRRAHSYQQVFDSRNRRVRGMWKRNGHFYANLTVDDGPGPKCSRWVKLEAVTFDGARKDYHKLITERDENRLRSIGESVKLEDYKKDYEEQLAASGKRPATIKKESAYLLRWVEKLPRDIRLNKLRACHLSKVLTELSNGKDGEDGYAGRSVNLHLVAIRGLLKAAHRDGHIKPPLPFEGLEWRRVDTKKRDLFEREDVDLLCEIALRPATTKNGRQFVDYLRFLQYSGARRNEALTVRWKDVDFDRRLVTIGAEGDSKNREGRYVNFSPDLQAHLEAMKTRRQPDSQWLFPSPQRGDKDIPAKSYLESLKLTRKAAATEAAMCTESGSAKRKAMLLNLRRFCFHDLRHHFVSVAVMKAIDFMTIAAWVGHKDGGVLIGKVYGHVANKHREEMAARMNFSATIVQLPETPNPPVQTANGGC